jgi:hypothetical protein
MLENLLGTLLPLILDKMGYSKEAFDRGIAEAKQIANEARQFAEEFKQRALASEESLKRIEAKLTEKE